MKLVLFGAGNIGRSFVAPLFVRAGYDVVFVDVNDAVVRALAERHSYDVVTVSNDAPAVRARVEGVRVVHGADTDAVSRELLGAALAATAVGKAALPAVSRAIAAGLQARSRYATEHNTEPQPLDVILAENVRDCSSMVRRSVVASGGDTALLGLVETSIGKMVPIVPAGEAARDPLVVYAEPYNTLIVDARGFLGSVPDVVGLHPVERIDAYVDRKLFVHNLGHAAVAYLGYRSDPSVRLLADALARSDTRGQARRAMRQSCAALLAEYPEVFRRDDLEEHVDDLMERFANRALGDTVHRVGRDLARKLGRDDRLVGAMLLCARHELAFDAIAEVYRAALGFDCPDESDAAFPADVEFIETLGERGTEWAFTAVSGLDPGNPADARVIAGLR